MPSGSQRTVTVGVEPRRGTIYDRNGVVLATTVDAYNFFCHPHKLQDPEQIDRLVSTLVQVCGGNASEYREKIEQDTNFVYLFKGADEKQLEAVKDLGTMALTTRRPISASTRAARSPAS